MNKNKLITFIMNHERQYTLSELSNVTGEDENSIRKIVTINNLSGYVKGRYDDVITDIVSHEKGTYNIKELCEKYDFKYITLYKHLKSVGLVHLCCRRTKNLKGTFQILEWSKNHTVFEMSEMAKKQGIYPASRQGIYDVLSAHNIEPITKFSRRNNEQCKENTV